MGSRSPQIGFLLPVLPKWICICDGERWCYMPLVWHPCRPRTSHVFTWQHYMWHNICGILQVGSSPACWLWRFQLQRVGLYEDGACRYCHTSVYLRTIIRFLGLPTHTVDFTHSETWKTMGRFFVKSFKIGIVVTTFSNTCRGLFCLHYSW
jgi:hypothetical protein